MIFVIDVFQTRRMSAVWVDGRRRIIGELLTVWDRQTSDYSKNQQSLTYSSFTMDREATTVSSRKLREVIAKKTTLRQNLGVTARRDSNAN